MRKTNIRPYTYRPILQSWWFQFRLVYLVPSTVPAIVYKNKYPKPLIADGVCCKSQRCSIIMKHNNVITVSKSLTSLLNQLQPAAAWSWARVILLLTFPISFWTELNHESFNCYCSTDIQFSGVTDLQSMVSLLESIWNQLTIALFLYWSWKGIEMLWWRHQIARW